MNDDKPASEGYQLVCLLDENIGRSVGDYLIELGHRAIESRDVVGPQALDQAIEFLGIQENMVILTHDRDFKTNIRRSIPKRLGRNATVLWLHVRETRSLRRLQQCHDVIEFHFDYARSRHMKLELITLSEVRVEERAARPGALRMSDFLERMKKELKTIEREKALKHREEPKSNDKNGSKSLAITDVGWLR